jgi:hypothetical protein
MVFVFVSYSFYNPISGRGSSMNPFFMNAFSKKIGPHFIAALNQNLAFMKPPLEIVYFILNDSKILSGIYCSSY